MAYAARVPVSPRIRAARLVLDDALERETIDEIASRTGELFAADLAARPSRHVYVSALPRDLALTIDRVRALPQIEHAIRAQLSSDVEITSMRETDELYLCHYNEDFGGDHGLFAPHYDGNLRFLPFGTVVRALVYVRSSGSFEVVFEDSQESFGFVSYDVGLLDFHRERHHVTGRYASDAPERILLKCNYLVLAPSERWLRAPLLAVNLGQFYVVKAAMEYSKSPRTWSQHVVGWVCNGIRLLNNAHPILPHVAMLGALATLVAVVWAVAA